MKTSENRKYIKIRGANEHNLKNIDVDIPRDEFVVLTGLSGSGKSSLAFDTIYAEGQRRYMESLSSYARQFLGQMEKPNVEKIEGLSPAISIDQKSTNRNPRSTVGTVTEIYDYFRLLYARIGVPHCPKCGKEIKKQTVDQMVDQIMELPERTKIQLLAPVVRGRKGEHQKFFEQAKRSGYVRVVVDGNLYELSEEIKLEKNKKHNIEIVVDRLMVKPGIEKRLTDSIENVLQLADGLMIVDVIDGEPIQFSESFSCPDCGISIDEVEPRSFSFNNPFGACPTCFGLGYKMEFDIDLMIPDKRLSISEGAIQVMGWQSCTDKSSFTYAILKALTEEYHFSLDTPFREYPDEIKDVLINGTHGKELKERYKEIQLPEIIPVDIKELHRKKRMVGQFSPLLVQYMKEALEQKEQVILFQNRRGFAPMIECRTCGWVPKCKNCDVSLTYHKGINQLTCHYCGYTYQLPKACPACEGTELVNRGFGTEKIEDDIKILFPEAAVARMDLDTTRTRSAYEKIIADFEQGKTDILIGTQMVSKGLDFDHVSIVGILNADTMLNYPDFRSYERAFQLMAQVAGRAGRKNKRGRVILQTKSIDHPIIHQVIANDYEDMVGGQLAERQMFHYPPYYRLVYVYLKNHNESLLDQMAAVMAGKLRAVFGNRVLGPDKPPVARIQTLFIKKIVVKIEQNAPMGRARELLLRIQREMLADERYKSLIVYYDVDPM